MILLYDYTNIIVNILYLCITAYLLCAPIVIPALPINYFREEVSINLI